MVQKQVTLDKMTKNIMTLDKMIVEIWHF